MNTIPSTFSSRFNKRRAQLLAQLPLGALVLIANAPQVRRNGGVHYPYRPNSYFYYLTGFTEPNAIAVLRHTAQGKEFILFNAARNPLEERWTGMKVGQLRACMEYEADKSYPIADFSTYLPHYLAQCAAVYFLFEQDFIIKTTLEKMQGIASKSSPSAHYGKAFQWVDLAYYLDEMRLIKQPDEIQCLRQAAHISAKAHQRAMQHCRPGLYEYQMEAELLYEFYQHGCRSTAYDSIVATGANACVLHYTQNQTLLEHNQLLLIDAGCEYHYYASDITRTFPVTGRFTLEQRALYQLVLDTQMTIIHAVQPGISWELLEQRMAQTLTEGLQALGILKGQTHYLLEQKAYRRFCPHSLGHWLGLDVHDVGDYGSPRGTRSLVSGMVFTIEPGLYITEDMVDIESKWHHIGIRIEDDILVTDTGYEVLSKEAPKTIEEIENLFV